MRGVFIGLSTIDIVYGVEEFPAPNTKVAARSQSIVVGGPATNAAIAFAHLGGEAVLVTAVGRNALSAVVREELERYSIQLIDLTPDFDGVPALSSVTVDGHGNRNVVSANAARFTVRAAEIDRKLCQETNIFLVDGHSMEACQAWAAAAHAAGKRVVLDGGSWKEGTGELLKCVHTAICSADFLPPGCGTKEEVTAYLSRHGVANMAITDGPEPIEFQSGQSSGRLLVPDVEVADTMGAGDILHGAYCAFAAEGRGFVESLAEAAMVASESCRYAGTREWMKHMERAPAETGTKGRAARG